MFKGDIPSYPGVLQRKMLGGSQIQKGDDQRLPAIDRVGQNPNAVIGIALVQFLHRVPHKMEQFIFGLGRHVSSDQMLEH